jgi:DNA polymerase zeta
MSATSEFSHASQKPALRVQINQIDHTLIQPGSLDNSSLPRVPVIRIFGSSSLGKKTCLHVHQVYPYFFVEYIGKLNVTHGQSYSSGFCVDPNFFLVNRYITKLTHSLDHAIALSFKRNPLSPNARYIRAVILVKGVHFYGFHSSYSPFLKVLVADPACINRAATILQSGAVMGTRFRVFESHLSYILQFMCDFGLYGCGWIDISGALERYGSDDSDVDDVHFSPSPYFRQSRMPLEVDAIAPQILNRHRIVSRNLHHKLEIPAPPLPPEPLVLSVRELWEDERARRRALGLNPSPEIPADPSDSSRAPGGNWVSEARWWEELRTRIERERCEGRDAPPTEPDDWQKWTMSTFESVEALWDESWRVWRPIRNYEEVPNLTQEASQEYIESVQERPDTPNEVTEIYHHSDIEVDFAMLSSQEISEMIEREEAERARLLGDDEQYVEEDEPDPYGDETVLNADSPVQEVDSQLTDQDIATFVTYC